MNLNCPNCKNAFEVVRSGSQTEVTCPSCKSKISLIELLSIDPELSRTRTYNDAEHTHELGESIAQFRLDKVLGHGGFGTVYEAFDARLERRVAVKVPKLAALSRWQAEVFIREAQAAAQLQHPNIVSVFEIGREGGRVYIVSELVDGVTLNNWRDSEKPNAKQAATMVAKIARALHVAHAAGVVHRDIKPRNILVDDLGEPHITDFGLAKRENPNNESITRSGQVIGTPAYMSPEQAQGKADEADGRTDIYSLGVVLYEMLVGKRPFRGETDVISEEVVRGGATPPRELDKSIHPDIDAICMKALERLPGKRFRSAGEFAEDLESYSSDLPTKALPPTRGQLAARSVRKNKKGIILVVLGVVFGLATIGGWWWYSSLPADNRKIVEIAVSEPNSVVRIAKVDVSSGWIDYAKIVVLDPSRQSHDGVYRTRLSQGWHIIEVETQDGKIAEVWRLIPENEFESTNLSFNTTAWTSERAGVIRLHPITVKPKREELVLCEGGFFETGFEGLESSGKSMRPRSKLFIEDFLISPYEVTTAEYERIMGALPHDMIERFEGKEIPSDLAVTNVSFNEAIEYAERVGGRLPVLEEYLYAATNGGKTEFPWGNDWIFDRWSIGKIGVPAKDKSATNVFNLYSNVCEWSGDFAVPQTQKFGKDTPIPESLVPVLRGMSTSKLVVGGPAFAGSISVLPQNLETPRFVTMLPTDGSNLPTNGLGLRVYRSVSPRLVKDSKLVEYYLKQRKNH